VPLAVTDLTSSLQYLNAGQLRTLAITSEKRAKALPNVPTINVHWSRSTVLWSRNAVAA
jgi:tripartite-type tricarboxylate transporter receptor subunit TctC